MKRTKTGHILGYVEAEVYESLYSDAGLNILGLARFSILRKDVGLVANWWSELKNLPKASIMLFYPFKFCLSSKRSHIFYERIGYEEIKRRSDFENNELR